MVAEVQIVVFDPQGPPAVQGVFEPGTDRPSELGIARLGERVRRAGVGRCRIVLGHRDVVVHPRKTALAVHQDAAVGTQREASARGERSEPVGLRLAGAAECAADQSRRTGRQGMRGLHAGRRALHVRPGHVRLQTVDGYPALVVVAQLAA